jgi:hypothetical protein
MKRILIALLALAMASPAFAFGYISLLHDDAVVIAPDIYYGNLLLGLDYYGAGAKAEFALGFVPKLYAGGSAHLNAVNFNALYNGSIASIDVSAYAKYFIFSPDEGKALFGFPLAIGAAAGLGYGFETWRVGTIDGKYANPLKILAVGIVGYPLQLFGTTCTVSAAVGYVDNDFGYYVDFYYPLDDKITLNAYWCPIIGLGLSATIAL